MWAKMALLQADCYILQCTFVRRFFDKQCGFSVLQLSFIESGRLQIRSREESIPYLDRQTSAMSEEERSISVEELTYDEEDDEIQQTMISR
eukprot:TRINITY_DN728_c0_g4_i1.p1 TRINITY_DN728_c0_g4~~TRINITY_DN728_c0_g4_i1.p1  ORF type:complete len:104 (-),score=13.12 TRINITY_DN728_c0_g4_i1:86-358(-)